MSGVFLTTAAAASLIFKIANRPCKLTTPPHFIESSANDPRWLQLTAELQTKANRFPGRVSVYLKDLQTGRLWTHEPDELLPSASLIKIPIAASVLKKIESQELTLDTKITLTNQGRVSGSGRLKWQNSGTKFTVADLLFYMITESDNTATKLLLNRLGLEYFQSAFSSLGLLATNITPDGLRLSSRAVPRENYTTAREIGELLEQAYKGSLVSLQASQILIELMKNLKHRERLAKTLPRGWQIAHKTGLLRHACHDAGIIYSPMGDYILVVMTWKGPDYKNAKHYISKMGEITYRYYSGASDLAVSYPPSTIRGI